MHRLTQGRSAGGRGARRTMATLAAAAVLASGSLAQSDLFVGRAVDFITGANKGGAAAPGARRYKLRNDGSAAVQWSISTDAAWLGFSQTSGTLAPGVGLDVSAMVNQAFVQGLDKGRHDGRITIRDDSSGQVVADLSAQMHVGLTIDDQKYFRLNGKPFIPIAVWAQPPDTNWAAYHADLGMNVLCGNGYGDVSYNQAFLDAAEAHGMHGMLNFDASVQDHPALLAWYLRDEPDLHGVPPSSVLQTYNSWKSQDPDSLIMMNLTGFFYWDSNWGTSANDPLYREYVAIPDWVAFDFYPVTGFNRPDLVYVPGAATQFMSNYFLNQEKPTFTWIEAADANLSWTPPNTPGPTPEQMRFEIWDSIIQGATGIGYFTISFDPWSWANITPENATELRRTNRDLKKLSKLITTGPSNLAMSVTEQSGQTVNTTIRRRGPRAYWVFASNADMHQPYRSARVSFDFQQTPVSVEVYGENRSITPVGNGFTDDFAPLGVHIYRVRF